MDYSYILNISVPQKEKLLAFGFSEADGRLVLKKEIAGGQFYAEIKLSDKTLSADVFETATNEKYVLFNVASAQGAFVGQIRSEFQDVIEEIREKCFLSQDIKEKYVDFLHSYFNAPGDNPWTAEPYDSSTVYRCPNNKWFALIMQIKFKNLGFESNEPVWAVNLKAVNGRTLLSATATCSRVVSFIKILAMRCILSQNKIYFCVLKNNLCI